MSGNTCNERRVHVTWTGASTACLDDDSPSAAILNTQVSGIPQRLRPWLYR